VAIENKGSQSRSASRFSILLSILNSQFCFSRPTPYTKADHPSTSSLRATTGTAATANLDQFSIRRARIKFTYQMSPTSRFVLQPDISSSGVVLKDGYVEFTEPWTQWKNTLVASPCAATRANSGATQHSALSTQDYVFRV
jgi:hypothetical protein